MTVYDIGDVVRLETTTKVGNVLTDATTVTLTVRDPAGVDVVRTLAGGTVVRDSVGAYHAEMSPTTDGTYLYRWVTTGTAAGAEEGSFQVSKAWSTATLFKPTPGQVHALIAQRPTFTDTSKPTVTEVQYLIDQRTADVLGELDGAVVPPNLFGLAQRTIALGAAADIESGYYPEQQLADSQHASLTARYLQALSRFQQLLAEQGGGPIRVGTTRAAGGTLTAWKEQAAAAGTDPNLWPDAWYFGY